MHTENISSCKNKMAQYQYTLLRCIIFYTPKTVYSFTTKQWHGIFHFANGKNCLRVKLFFLTGGKLYEGKPILWGPTACT